MKKVNEEEIGKLLETFPTAKSWDAAHKEAKVPVCANTLTTQLGCGYSWNKLLEKFGRSLNKKGKKPGNKVAGGEVAPAEGTTEVQ